MTDAVTVTVDDCRKVGHCVVPGTRDWFVQHGFDFRDFVRNGISSDTLEATGDHFVTAVVARARERLRNG